MTVDIIKSNYMLASMYFVLYITSITPDFSRALWSCRTTIYNRKTKVKTENKSLINEEQLSATLFTLSCHFEMRSVFESYH